MIAFFTCQRLWQVFTLFSVILTVSAKKKEKKKRKKKSVVDFFSLNE